MGGVIQGDLGDEVAWKSKAGVYHHNSSGPRLAEAPSPPMHPGLQRQERWQMATRMQALEGFCLEVTCNFSLIPHWLEHVTPSSKVGQKMQFLHAEHRGKLESRRRH